MVSAKSRGKEPEKQLNKRFKSGHVDDDDAQLSAAALLKASSASDSRLQLEDHDSEDEEEEEEEEEQDEESDEGEDEEPRVRKGGTTTTKATSTSYITASSGDAYLLHSAAPARTSDTRLSSYLHPPFTLSSYLSTLASVHTAAPPAENDAVLNKFTKWRYELKQGFNILMYGWGSKRQVVNQFAEEAREEGDVVLVNGYDDMVGMADILTAIEGVVRRTEAEQEDDGAVEHALKSGKTQGRVNPLSPLESRAHRLLPALSSTTSRPIFLIIHSLDRSSALRNPKNISLLALLASQRRLRFVASIDHLRASLLFPHSLAAGRPTFSSSSTSPSTSADQRSFNFLYHLIPIPAGTTPPSYLLESLYSQTLSHIFPSSVFPSASTTFSLTGSSSSGSGAGGANQITATSASYVLASVTSRSVSLFSLLASIQMSSPYYSNRNNGSKLAAGEGGGMYVIPSWATKLDKIKKIATERLLANSNEQVEALLSEFLDHHVVRKGEGEPQKEKGAKGIEEMQDEGEGEGDGDGEEEDENEGGNEWIWVPLRKEELEEVVQGLDDDGT